MRIAWGLSLAAVAAVLCVACYQNDMIPGDTNEKSGKNDFGSGSLEDCSAVSPSTSVITASEFDGVDMLVVVDNSGSMAEEQAILSTGFFTLINALTRPLLNDPTWTYPAVDNVRLAVVSSDLGLSYGENRETALSPSGILTCTAGGGNGLGDNGDFLSVPSNVANIQVTDGQIRCEAGDGVESGGQCPPEFTCGDIDPNTHIGVCRAPGGVTVVNCNSFTSEYASSTYLDPNPDLAGQAACLAAQGTTGCGFEQQLEAAVTGLANHPDFIVDTHLLAVMIVSDEEDCSIMDPGLFSTAEWNTPQLQNIVCNISPENEAHLFPTTRYRNMFTSLKNGMASGVIFAAIVGVPTAAESAASGWPLCEGTGLDIENCLSDNPAMTIQAMEFIDSAGNAYRHFAPSCVRNDPATGVRITEARPGRRYVSVAQEFQENSFVYSICNADWSPVMVSIAELIAGRMSPSCFPKKLDWNPVSTQPSACEEDNCGVSTCDMAVRISRGIDDSEDCPADFYANLSDAEKQNYLDRKAVVPVTSSNGEVIQKSILCPLPKLATPIDCISARSMEQSMYNDRVGWYYCENNDENFQDACSDALDNDGDGLSDCEDDGCAACAACGGTGESCGKAECRFGVNLTYAAKAAVRGNFVTVQCLQQTELSDEACNADENGSLGSSCVQPGFSEDETADSDGVDAVSFQKGCDCMTYRSVLGPDNTAYNHFCTRPCDVTANDCPAGFGCSLVMPDILDAPDGMSPAYCLPDCLETPCEGFDEVCLPTGDDGAHWTCQLP